MTMAAPPAAPAPAVSASRARAGESPAIAVRGLTKRFPQRRAWAAALRRPRAREHVVALDDVTLDVRRGTCVGLLGPNGAGKSTLFRVLLTLVLPDAGSAQVEGLDVVDDAALVRARVAGAGADERSLYWRLSARENLRLYASLRGMDGASRDGAVRDALDAVGLGPAADRLAGSLSTGTRQRLLVARALLGRPGVLLLDEPTRSQDPVAAQAFRALLRDELVARRGCTVLLATHTAEEAFDVCDRVVVLDRGRVAARGPARRMAERLADDRWEVVLRADAATAAATLARAPTLDVLSVADERDGWTRARVLLPGGAEAAAALVGRLVAGRVAVGGIARVAPSLAELVAGAARLPAEDDDA